MKRFAWHILLTLVATIFISVAPVTQTAYAEGITDAPVIVLSAATSGKEVTVEAALVRNSGISGLTVEITYDAEVMTLTNVERGNALSSLEHLTTNVDTEQGYAITPFRINWSGDENDTSTGNVLKMSFLIKEAAPDGDYLITLKGVGSKPVSYLNGKQIETKGILIDSVKIRLKGDEIEPVAVEELKEPKETEPNVPLIVGLSVSGGVVVIAAGTCGVIFVVKKKGKKKSWKEIK